MSLTVDGVWKAGVWATTIWANGVWFEGVRSVHGGKGDNQRIFKPVPFLGKGNKRVKETRKPQKVEVQPLETMSTQEIDFEIGVLLHKQFKTQEDELILLLLMAASGA